MAGNPTFGDLYKGKPIVAADLDAAVDAFMADPSLTTFLMGEGYALNPHDPVSAGSFALGMLARPDAKLDARKMHGPVPLFLLLGSLLLTSPVLALDVQGAQTSPLLTREGDVPATKTANQRDASGLTITAPNGVPRSLQVRFEDQVWASDFGALCDGLTKAPATDDTAAIHAAMKSAGMGGIVHLPRGKSCYVTGLKVPPGVTLRGSSGTVANPGGTNKTVLLGRIGGLLLEASGTIELGGASGLQHLLVLRADDGVSMQLPAADASAYAGDCITAASPTGPDKASSGQGSDGYVIDNVLCVGQSRALVSTGASRAWIGRFAFDANPGAGRAAVTISGSHDTTRVRDLHGWPYGTSDKTGSVLRRVGTGLLLSGSNDDTQIDSALLINFDINVDIQSASAVQIGRLWTDTGAQVPGSRGLRFGANTSDVNIMVLNAWGSEIGIESAASLGNRNSIAIAHTEKNADAAILVSGGNLHIGNATTRGVPPGRPVLNITSSTSFVSGLVNDENNGSNSPVIVVAGVTTDKVADLRVISPYRTAGTAVFGGNPLSYPTIASTDPIQLPPSSDRLRVTGRINARDIGGGWGGRRVTLRTVDGGVFRSGPRIRSLKGSDITLKPGSTVVLEYDADEKRWNELTF